MTAQDKIKLDQLGRTVIDLVSDMVDVKRILNGKELSVIGMADNSSEKKVYQVKWLLELEEKVKKVSGENSPIAKEFSKRMPELIKAILK